MYCQKCRTPLKLDSSLEDLNPAAFDLLLVSLSVHHPINSSSNSIRCFLTAATKNIPASRPAYPQERKQLYDRVSQCRSPTFKRNISAPRRTESSFSSNPGMSFVMLTESQVVPPAIVKSPEDTKPETGGKMTAQGQKTQQMRGKPCRKIWSAHHGCSRSSQHAQTSITLYV